MKFIHTADWHLGRSLNEYPLLEDQIYWLNGLEQLLREQKPEALVIAGDVYDRGIPPVEAVTLLDQTLTRFARELGVKVLVIAGNHDNGARLSFGSRLYQESGLYVAGAPEKEIRQVRFERQQTTFWLLPYFTPAQLRPLFPEQEIGSYQQGFEALMAYNRQFVRPGEKNVLVAHGFFQYLRQGHSGDELLFSDSELSVGGADLIDLHPADWFDYVALGHLHAPQVLGDGRFRYSGSMLKYSVSEALQKKGVNLVELTGEGLQVQRIELPSLRNLRVVTGSLEQILEANRRQPDTGDYVFANLTQEGGVLNPMGRLREVFPCLLGIEFLSRKREEQGRMYLQDRAEDPYVFRTSAEIWEPDAPPEDDMPQGGRRKKKAKTPVELFADFYQLLKEEPLPENRRKLIEQAEHQARLEENGIEEGGTRL